jgi:hypothetical protein
MEYDAIVSGIWKLADPYKRLSFRSSPIVKKTINLGLSCDNSVFSAALRSRTLTMSIRFEFCVWDAGLGLSEGFGIQVNYGICYQ